MIVGRQHNRAAGKPGRFTRDPDLARACNSQIQFGACSGLLRGARYCQFVVAQQRKMV